MIAVSGTGAVGADDDAVAVRGAPGAALLVLDAATGAPGWTTPVGATGWVVVRAVAAIADGAALVGSFAEHPARRRPRGHQRRQQRRLRPAGGARRPPELAAPAPAARADASPRSPSSTTRWLAAPAPATSTSPGAS
ncbi:MAG: hypothetical protein R2939_18120 [Kofleriaceae bacterium]